MTAPAVTPAPPIDRRWAAATLAGCVAIAVAALAVPATLAYDPWAWLVWSRELIHLDLDTTGGPSWKPLPVLVATIVAPFGGTGPELWLVLARTAGLLSVVGTYRLARRFAGRVGGGLAAALLLLTPDGGPRFVRLVLEGHSAPVTAGLAVWALDRHLDGRRHQALVLLTVLCLDRPEAWPFLAGYGSWLAVREPRQRPLVALVGLAVLPLWFGLDWWGSGSPTHGAGTAQVSTGDADRVGDAIERARMSVVAPVWLAAVAGAARGWREQRVLTALFGLAGAWTLLVVAMSAGLGYAALARFFLPAAGLLCVVAAVAVMGALARVPSAIGRSAVAVGIAAVASVSVVPRLANVGSLFEEIEARATAEDDLAAVVQEVGGPDALTSCGLLSIDTGDVPRPALAWHARVPLAEVRRAARAPAGTMVVRVGGRAEARLLGVAGPAVTEVARHGGWAVFRSATCKDS